MVKKLFRSFAAASTFSFLILARQPGPAVDSLPAANLPQPKSVDQVLQLYVKAAGGAEAIDRIQTREVQGKIGHRKVTYYWQKPNKVLQLYEKAKVGYDGGAGWEISSKKHVKRLPKGEEAALEMNANPLRYIHLRDLFHDLQTAPAAMLNDKAVDVLISPNNIGATKFFFDAASHLLCRIEEFGVTSAYYNHVTDFENYKEVEGIQLPHRVVHQSNEPGTGSTDFHISKVKQNVELDPVIFTKPNVAPVTLGGKR